MHQVTVARIGKERQSQWIVENYDCKHEEVNKYAKQRYPQARQMFATLEKFRTTESTCMEIEFKYAKARWLLDQ